MTSKPSIFAKKDKMDVNVRMRNNDLDDADVALISSDGDVLEAHITVLRRGSSYFNYSLRGYNGIDMINVNVSSAVLKILLDFMYLGEVVVENELYEDAIAAAAKYKIDGFVLKLEEPKVEAGSSKAENSDFDLKKFVEEKSSPVKGGYFCKICTKIVKSKGLYHIRRHFERHHVVNKEEFFCGACQKTIYTRYNMKEHIYYKHPELKSIDVNDFKTCDVVAKKSAPKASPPRKKIKIEESASKKSPARKKIKAEE